MLEQRVRQFGVQSQHQKVRTVTPAVNETASKQMQSIVRDIEPSGTNPVARLPNVKSGRASVIVNADPQAHGWDSATQIVGGVHSHKRDEGANSD